MLASTDDRCFGHAWVPMCMQTRNHPPPPWGLAKFYRLRFLNAKKKKNLVFKLTQVYFFPGSLAWYPCGPKLTPWFQHSLSCQVLQRRAACRRHGASNRMAEVGGTHRSKTPTNTSEPVPGKVPSPRIRGFLQSQPIPTRTHSPSPLIHSHVHAAARLLSTSHAKQRTKWNQ